MSVYHDISSSARKRGDAAAARLLAERDRFVGLLGGDHPEMDGWLREIAIAYFTGREVAVRASKIQDAENELRDDKRAIGRVLRMAAEVNWCDDADHETMLRVLRALDTIADKRIRSLTVVRKPHRQAGGETAIPYYTLSPLGAVFKAVTGDDPLAIRSNTSPFCNFVCLFMEVIGERRAIPADLWRNVRVSMRRWPETQPEVRLAVESA